MMIRLIVLGTLCCAGLSCSGERAVVTMESGPEEGGKYSTSFPGPGRSGELEDALHSVRMIGSVGFYRQADFRSPLGWPADRPVTDRIWREADTLKTFTESVVGTGTIVQFSRSRIALLTSAHVVTFDDTVTTYFRDDSGPTGIRSFAVKVRQRNHVTDIAGAGELQVLARDDRLDIAIVGQSIDTRNISVPVFTIPPGRAHDLDWGSFVYVVGYPVGLRMVTSGIVSQPRRSDDDSFLTDVVFNRGMSGGVVLASRPGASSLEWVGMTTSGSAMTENTLVPREDDLHEGHAAGEPYEGEVFVSRIQRVRYGVTMVVSIESVRRMVAENRVSLLRKGYRLDGLE